MHEGSQEYALLDAVIQVSPSVQVTVDSARFNAKVGAPVTTPVVELIVRPLHSAGEIINVVAPGNPVSTYTAGGVIASPTCPVIA